MRQTIIYTYVIVGEKKNELSRVALNLLLIAFTSAILAGSICTQLLAFGVCLISDSLLITTLIYLRTINSTLENTKHMASDFLINKNKLVIWMHFAHYIHIPFDSTKYRKTCT